MNRRPCLALALLVTANLLGCGEPAYTPKKNKLKMWEPFRWQRGSLAGDNIVKRVVGEKQGYSPDVARYFDDTARDTQAGTCQPDVFTSFPNDNGIALVLTHGHKGYFVAAGFGNTAADQTAANNWRNGLADKENISVKYNSVLKIYVVRAWPAWLTRRWQPAFNNNRSIVVMMNCYSNASSSSGRITDAVGGRTRFGYNKYSYGGGKSARDMDVLFGNMNGRLPEERQGLLRKAGYAIKGPFETKGFKLRGSKWTTLCPSVENPPKDHVKPVGPGAGRSGRGFVEFDTHCDTSVDLEELLVCETKGGWKISDRQWDGDTIVRFKYSTDCIAEDDKAKMIVRWEHLKAEGGGGQKLDGGEEIAECEYLPDKEGVAPNKDNFVWKFSL